MVSRLVTGALSTRVQGTVLATCIWASGVPDPSPIGMVRWGGPRVGGDGREGGTYAQAGACDTAINTKLLAW